MPVEVLEAEVINSAPYIEGLDNSVGGQIEVYTSPVQQAPAAKYGNTIPSNDRGLDGLVDSKGRPLTYRDANGVEQWNRAYEFDDIPDYGTPEFNDWANGADLDPEAFDNFVGRNRTRIGARALDALESVAVVIDIAQGIWDTPGRYAEGRDLFRDAFPGVPAIDMLGGFLGAFAPTYPLLGALDFVLPGSPDGLPIMAPGEPVFRGGQCKTAYRLSFTYFRDGSDKPATESIFSVRGPVFGYRFYKSGGDVRWAVAHLGSDGVSVVETSSRIGGIDSVSDLNDAGPVQIERVDGQPDNCGDPAGELEPQSPTVPTITSTPDAPPIPGLEPPPTRPEEVDSPPTVPELDTPPEVEPEITGDPPIEPVRPDLPELPPIPEIPEKPETDSPPESEQPPAQDGPPGDSEGDCCDRTTQDLGALRERLDQLLRHFEETGTEAIDRAPCNSDHPAEDTWTGAGFTGVYRGLETLSRAVEDIWTEIKCGEDAIAIPEWWAVRPGADVPQLAITFKAEEGSSYWSLTIPHYTKPKNVVPQVPRYDKGSIFATLTLKDNTKLTVNAKTFEEGERVIYALVGYIDPAYLPNPLDIHQGRRKGAALKEVKVRPTRGYFYATGQQDTKPDWVTDIEVI